MAADLYPEKSFQGSSSRGDVAITNMSRPQRGLIGIRLEKSEEFGPTGEEAPGTNLLGRFVGDLDAMMSNIADGDIIYIRRASPEESAPIKMKKATKPKDRKAGSDGNRNANKKRKAKED